MVANSPDAQDQTSSPPEPTIALGPVTLPTGCSEFLMWCGIMALKIITSIDNCPYNCFVSAPSAPSASPPVAKGAVSPAVPTRPQNAPTPVTPPKGSSSRG